MHHQDLAHQRHTLRQQALQRRTRLDATHHASAAQALKQHGLPLLHELLASRTSPVVIGGYWPVRGEIDVRPLLHELHAQGHDIALPVVARRNAPLTFHRYTPGMRLAPGAFGIPAPPAHSPILTPHVLLIPLVAFDARGHRLGYGGGYYDRTLAALRHATDAPPIAIGCAHACQQVEHIPTLPTDMRLHCILTERGIIRPMEPVQHA